MRAPVKTRPSKPATKWRGAGEETGGGCECASEPQRWRMSSVQTEKWALRGGRLPPADPVRWQIKRGGRPLPTLPILNTSGLFSLFKSAGCGGRGRGRSWALIESCPVSLRLWPRCHDEFIPRRSAQRVNGCRDYATACQTPFLFFCSPTAHPSHTLPLK